MILSFYFTMVSLQLPYTTLVLRVFNSALSLASELKFGFVFEVNDTDNVWQFKIYFQHESHPRNYSKTEFTIIHPTD